MGAGGSRGVKEIGVGDAGGTGGGGFKSMAKPTGKVATTRMLEALEQEKTARRLHLPVRRAGPVSEGRKSGWLRCAPSQARASDDGSFNHRGEAGPVDSKYLP